MLLAAPEHAESVVDRIVQATERLGDFPRMGRTLPHTRDFEAREIIVDRFHVVYAIDGETVEISTILHGAMDIATRLHELLGDA